MENGGLVGPQFKGFLRKAHGQYRCHAYSSHDRTFVTGGLPGRRGVPATSAEAKSLGQISARNSDISTNSSVRMLFTSLGGREAAGLYGPVLWSDRIDVLPPPDPGCAPCVVVCPNAASARTSSVEVSPLVGVNVGRDGRCAGSGISPSCWVLRPVIKGGHI